MKKVFILCLFFLSTFISSCDFSQSGKQTAETKQMIEELKQLVLEGNPRSYYHWNGKMAALLKEQIATAAPADKESVWYNYCLQMMYSGDNETAIKELEKKLLPLVEENIRPDNQIVYELLATAYLRLGERENCQNGHTPYSCILPLNEAAMHELKEGSKKAKELFSMLNNRVPSARYLWLQNLAAMTLGEYPINLPNAALPFPNWNLERKDFLAFKDISMNIGVAENGLSGGTCIDDFNNDGFLDIFATSYGMEDQVKLFLNNGKGAFDDVTIESGLEGITSGLNCIHADYDNDGDRDILILRGAWLGPAGAHPNSLLRNDGQGHFDDVSRSSGLLSYHPTQTASWGDYNKDGFLDLFIGNEGNSPGHPCELYKNNQDGTFTEVSDEVGLGNINYFVKGVVWGDINNDQWPDLYISVQGGNNILFKNQKGKFENITVAAGVGEPFYSFPCWFWDVNNDGFEDIFVSGYDGRFLHEIGGDYARELNNEIFLSERPRLYINNGDETFSEHSKKYKVDKTMYAMGSNFGDLDNDGFLDFYVGTGSPNFTSVVPNRMFRNKGGELFEEVTSAGGFGHIQKGHGVAFADLDNDGDQDIYAVMGGAFEGDVFTNVLFENPISKNNWITIELQGKQTNRDAIGTKVELLLENGMKIFRVVNTGGSFGASSLQQEIGLGSSAIKELIIHWQNSEKEIIRDLTVNKKIIIQEGTGEINIPNFTRLLFETTTSQKQNHHH